MSEPPLSGSARPMVLHSSELAVPVYRHAGFEPCPTAQAYVAAPLWYGEH